MTGIFLLAVLAIALTVAVMIARCVARPIRSAILRFFAVSILTVVLMSLLVVDEIVGGYQFGKLCENSVLKIDAEKARGKTVKLVIEPSNEILRGTAITIYRSHFSYRDVSTNEEIASNDEYKAKGGWFIRMLGVFETNGPLTISPSYCSLGVGDLTIAKNYGFFIQQ